jgi:hypothetical protein
MRISQTTAYRKEQITNSFRAENQGLSKGEELVAIKGLKPK